MEKHKQMLDREYEQLLTQFSRELERLQLKHQEELGKRVIHIDSLWKSTAKFNYLEKYGYSYIMGSSLYCYIEIFSFIAEKQHKYGKETY